MPTQIATGRRKTAQNALLEPNDLDIPKVESALEALWGRGVNFADLYFETTAREEWQLEHGTVSRASFSIMQGVGARAVVGEKTAFAYSSAIGPRALLAVTDATRSMQFQGQDASIQSRHTAVTAIGSDPNSYPAIGVSADLDPVEKVALLRSVDTLARAVDPRIVEVSARLSVVDSTVLVMATDGSLAGDVRPLIRLDVTVLAEDGARRSHGHAGGGGRCRLTKFDEPMVSRMVERATSTALTHLDARPAPAGVMSVVLGPGFAGLLLHEAVGHGLEGDAHRKRTSVFGGLMGQQIAASGVTVVDDATIAGARGSLNIDDEGGAGQRKVLIENGKLVGLMQDKTNARLMQGVTTGNGRRQSYAHLPMPRMSNTFLVAGKHDPAEIIASVKTGIYAVEFSGGTVDIASGQFNFSAASAYLIENGKITAPIQGATIIGRGHEALKHISMIGNDFQLDDASCGKFGQLIPVGVGQPTVRIDNMVVGGAQEG